MQSLKALILKLKITKMVKMIRLVQLIALVEGMMGEETYGFFIVFQLHLCCVPSSSSGELQVFVGSIDGMASVPWLLLC